jgi:hypothetical protein
MKIGGVELKGPNIEYLVFSRPDGDIVIKAQTVRDFRPFDAMVPYPKAPGIRTKDGFKPDLKDPGFIELLERYNEQRISYLIIQSLVPSEIEWEKVNLNDPSTWSKWVEELQEAGLSEFETNRIVVAVMQANSLDEAKLDAARQAFLLGQGQVAGDSSGQSTEQPST